MGRESLFTIVKKKLPRTPHPFFSLYTIKNMYLSHLFTFIILQVSLQVTKDRLVKGQVKDDKVMPMGRDGQEGCGR